jgi:type IX secretion system PorP/SprF family membrane protein
MNPAFAGSALVPRAIVHYRNQWPALESSYVTYSGSFDYFFPKINSGVGLLITRDQQSFANLNSIDIGGQYAYQLALGEKLSLRTGLQLSYVHRSVNLYGLNFGDQFDPVTFSIRSPTSENLGDGGKIDYLDASTGALLYSDKFWLGASAHHLNRPSQDFIGKGNPLPIRYTIHGGLKIPLANSGRRGLAQDVTELERSISPAFIYKAQAKFDQLDVGLYATLEPMVFGLWYRGLPIKRYEVGINNSDALIFLIGYKYEGLSVGYSYDLTISKLSPSTGGAHEISVTYEFPAPTRKSRIPRSARRLPCPKF